MHQLPDAKSYIVKVRDNCFLAKFQVNIVRLSKEYDQRGYIVKHFGVYSGLVKPNANINAYQSYPGVTPSTQALSEPLL